MTADHRKETLEAIDAAAQPFLVRDVAPFGAFKTEVWHFLRDLVEQGVLTHSYDGYRRAS